MVQRPALKKKKIFWEKIKVSNGAIPLPWVICGDFNVIFALQNKMSGIPNLVDIHNVQNLITELNVVEPPTFGRRFSWMNGQLDPNWVRLD